MSTKNSIIYPWLIAILLLGPVVGAGCGEEDDDGLIDEPMGTLLQPPEPGMGHQFVMTTELPAGTEAEHCKFVVGPPEGMHINHDEVRFSQGSHHFLLYETEYTSIPTQKEDGTPVDTSRVFDCSDGPTDGWRITKLIGGSQNGEGDSFVSFPPDVAMFVEPNAVLLMNAHYLNASDVPLQPEVDINLYTIPEADVVTAGDILFLYNPFIRSPAGQSSRARWRCPVHRDITIMNVQSHMHARGVDFAATVEGEEPFYTNTQWEAVPVGSFETGLHISAGSRLDYYCDYNNAGSTDVYQGARSTDEMCMLIGSYYPADPATANCLDPSLENLAGEWIGNGTATCSETLDCVSGALASEDFLPELTDCILDADPAVSREASQMALCIFYSQDPESECSQEISACQAT